MKMLYQRKTLPSILMGVPAPLPSELVGLSDECLADLSAAVPEAAQELGYAGQGFFPVEPDPPTPPPPSRVLNKVDFARLFTQAERIAIDDAANINPVVRDYDRMLSRFFKDLDKRRVIPCILCVLLGWIDKDHCEKALEPDEGKISGKPTQKLTPKLYIINIGISLSQLLNVVLGGDEDERLSSRAGKDARRGRKIACIFCRILHWIDRDHCEKAIQRDEGKRPGQYDDPRRRAKRTQYPPRSDWS